MLSSRQKSVLTKLLRSNHYVTIEFLAKWQNVSGRTIRYDLDAIDDMLKQAGAPLKREPGKGVFLHVGEEKRAELFRIAEGHQVFFDKNVHIAMMSLFAIMHETVTIQQLADEFHLSRSSIQKYLPDIEETLDRFGLQLARQARKGFLVNGTERSIRRAIFHWLTDKQVDLERVERWFDCEKDGGRGQIDRWLRSCQEDRQVFYSEGSLRVLTIFLCWWYERILHGHYVYIPQEEREAGHRLGELSEVVSALCDNRTAEHEHAFLNTLLGQAKVVSYKNDAVLGESYQKEKDFCTYLLEQISTILQVDLLKDKKLMNDLLYHMKAAFLRIEQGLVIDNPYTEEIKVRYRAIYEMVHQITADMGYTLVAAEVAFITMHVSAGFDRSKSKRFLPTVIVVCSTGLATSSILTTKLQQAEPGFHLINVVNTEDLEKALEESDVDFVLTTQELPIKQWNETKIFRVSPLLNDEDKRTIQHEAQKMINRKQLACFNQVYAHASAVEPTLFDETVHTANTSDWKESIALAAAPLLKAGYIRQGYVQEMIMSVERNGTYMVFLPKVAFVHAGPENVIKEGISMTIFEHEIDFGSFNPERVEVVIVLAIKEAHNQDFLQLFRYLETQEKKRAAYNEMDWEEECNMTEELIKKEHVAVGVQAKDWERAIEASGSLLVKSGAVTSEYVKQMVDSVKENGPYIVIGPGMAMAHARPSEAVHTDAVSLAVLKEAVPFGNEENDPVDLVFSFSATGAESHLHLIERLSRLLLDEEKVGQLREAKSAEDVYQIIS